MEPRILSSTLRTCEIRVLLRTNFAKRVIVNDLCIEVPIPRTPDRVTLKASTGRAKRDPATDSVLWRISYLPGEREVVLDIACALPLLQSIEHLSLEDAADPESSLPSSKQPSAGADAWKGRLLRIRSFEMPFFMASGFQVRYLKIVEKSGTALGVPWVRYLSQPGDLSFAFLSPPSK